MKHTRRRILWLLLIGLNLAFIWGNSGMTGRTSGNLSGGVVDFICKIIPFFREKTWFPLLIRKLAHFSEFGLLGLLCSGFSVSEWQKVPISILGAGLCAACIDETIQLFVPGRASSLLDVWIDSAGFATGLIVLLIGYNLVKNKQVWRKSQ